MGTEINVTVGPQSLKDRNRQEAEANRWRRAEQEAQRKLEAAAQDGLQQQAQQGPADGNPRRQQFMRQKPAAFRFGGRKYGHMWIQSFITERSNSGVISGGELLYALPGSPTLLYANAVSKGDFAFGRAFDHTLTPGAGGGQASYSSGLPVINPFPSGNMPPESIWPPGTKPSIPPYSVTVNINRDFNDQRQLITIPVGGDRFIVIVLHAWSYYSLNVSVPHFGEYITTANGFKFLNTLPSADLKSTPNGFIYDPATQDLVTDGQVLSKCYICSNRVIREISIPTKLQAIIDSYINPPFSLSPYAIRPPWTGNAFSNYTLTKNISTQIFQIADPYPVVGPGGMAIFATVCNPSVFQLLLGLSPDPSDAAQAKAFSSSKRWVISDTSDGFWTPSNYDRDYANKYNSAVPLRYGVWNVPNTYPDYGEDEDGNPVYDATLYQKDQAATLIPGLPPLSENAWNTQLIVSWDWDDPAYCRQMCGLLGFTEADLTP